MKAASDTGGAHLFVFHGREKPEENRVIATFVPYFRLRWLPHTLLKLIPHQVNNFFGVINQFLSEELEWIETVKPRGESCSLLLPQCSFSAAAGVGHLWTAATEAGIERIRLAARVREQFESTHWSARRNGARAWTDVDGRVFDHRGPRHGVAPFPRGWKFSYEVVVGFHFDVTSRDSRAFHVVASDGHRHAAREDGHINIDPHGYVRP
jgi:hypothetical protein